MKKKICKIITFVIASALMSLTSRCLATNAGASMRIAGNYICFEESDDSIQAALKQGIITVSGGRIVNIEPIGENLDGVVRLDDACVMFPGLIDLHSHVEYNFLQMWEGDENDAPWDNRFEWRRSAQYVTDIKDKQAILWSRWDEPFGEGEARVGDLIEYFVEAQAAAGGTTLIQGYNQTEEYDTADSHEKVDLIRSTCFSDDLGLPPGQELRCVIQIFKPDADIDTMRPESYLPPINTSEWKITHQLTDDGETDYLSLILDAIRNGTSSGWLIHLAEGRAGNLLPSTDPYSALEYAEFRNAIQSCIENGDFTAEDVRNAHIVLIHACGLDLDNREDYAFIRDCGIGLIWSPVSNLLLYGDTPVFYNYIDDDTLRIGIGSDWSPSGSKTVWDECKFAYAFMKLHADDPSNAAEQLLKACTFNAARMIGNTNVGNITVGGFADLFILRGDRAVNGSLETALATFIETGDSNVEAVIANGRTVYADIDYLKSLGSEELLSSYGRYETQNPVLMKKVFIVPALFEDYSFDELYRAYSEMVEFAQIDLSLLQDAEDEIYTHVMNDLEQRFCR